MPCRRRLRRTVIALLYPAIAIPVLWLSLLPAALRAGFLRDTIEAKLSQSLGMPVHIGALDLPNGCELTARHLKLRPNAPGLGPIEIDTALIRFRTLAPFGTVREVLLDGVRASIDLSPDQLREWTRPAAPQPGSEAPSRFRLAGPLPLPPIRASRIELSGRVGGDPYDVRDLEIRIDPATDFVISFGAKGLLTTSPDPKIDVRGALELTTSSGRVRLDRFKIGTLAAKAGFEVPRESSAAASVQVDSFSLPHALVSLLEALTGMKAHGLLTSHCTLSLENNSLSSIEFEGELTDYEVSGQDVRFRHRTGRTRLSLSVAPHPEGGWKARGRVADLEMNLGAGAVLHFPSAAYEARIDGARSVGTVRFEDAFVAHDDFESSQGTGQIAFDVTRDGNNRVFTGFVQLTLSHAEMLKGALYHLLDRADALSLTLAGRLDLEAGETQFKGSGISVGGLGRLSVDGTIRRTPAGLTYDVSLETGEMDAGSLTEQLRELELVDGLAAQGRVRARARFAGDAGAFRVEGRLFLSDLTIRWGGLSAVRLNAEVPLLLSRGETLNRAERGWIAFEDLIPCPAVSLGARRLEVVAGENSLRLPESFAFALWGGQARLGEIAMWNLMDDLHTELHFGVDGLDFARVAAVYGITRPLSGRASLPWGTLLISGPQITVAQNARIGIFEGEIALQHLRILNPFDRIRRAYRFGFDMTAIRLREVCRTLTEFGLIDGVAEAAGQIELHASGLPNWFDVRLRTVRRRDVTQECDLQAVRALAMLIGGPDVARQIARIPAERLSYKKFGFYAFMDVDFTFYPRGLYFQRADGEVVLQDVADLRKGRRPSEPGREFIMIGAGMRRVNIDIVNPGGGLDFNDIIDRFNKVKK
ncbi:MAG: hypothetical protein HYY16_02195 [Planctomycetes bacterium]|nr:hypothetical protein [Planctomycetota bacterium]